MTVMSKPVPALGDFMEILGYLDCSDIVALKDDIRAYEEGSPLSVNAQDILARAECVAEANRIMARIG